MALFRLPSRFISIPLAPALLRREVEEIRRETKTENAVSFPVAASCKPCSQAVILACRVQIGPGARQSLVRFLNFDAVVLSRLVTLNGGENPRLPFSLGGGVYRWWLSCLRGASAVDDVGPQAGLHLCTLAEPGSPVPGLQVIRSSFPPSLQEECNCPVRRILRMSGLLLIEGVL